MSNTNFADLSSALDKHLDDMPGLPPVAWPNKGYIPVVGTLYLKPTLLPATTFAATIGGDVGSNNRFSGIYQIDIFSEAAEGKGESMVMADLIADRFYRDQNIVFNGLQVTIISGSQRIIGADDGWYQTAVDIEYYAFALKRQ